MKLGARLKLGILIKRDRFKVQGSFSEKVAEEVFAVKCFTTLTKI
jgi:hypothetical protein